MSLFLLDSTGKCSTCSESSQPNHIITCATCCKHFHGYCSVADDSNFIARKSFLIAWHSPSVKSNFQWHCDSCKTKLEERAVSKMEDRFEQLCSLVSNLTEQLSSVKNTLGTELDEVKTKLNQITLPILNSKDDNLSPLHSATNVTPWANKEKVKSIKSSLVLKCKEGGGTVDKEAELAKLKTLAVSNNIPVARVGHDKDGNTYVDCPTAQGSSLLKPLLTANFQDKNVSDVKEKLPCVSIVGIEDEITKSNFANLLCKQNPEINTLISAGEEFNVLFVKTAKDGTFTAVVRVSSIIRTAIRSMRNRVFLGLSSCRVFDRFYIKRCNHCQELGHYRDNCCNTVSCAYCGGDHESESCNLKDCTDTSKFSCINCKKAGKEHVRHTLPLHSIVPPMLLLRIECDQLFLIMTILNTGKI